MKRYDRGYNCHMDEDPTGFYVEYDEVAELIQKLVDCINHHRRGRFMGDLEFITYYANGGLSETAALELAEKNGFKPTKS